MISQTKPHGITAIILLGLLLTTINTDGAERGDRIPSLERIPASLIRLSSGETYQLSATDGRKFTSVEGFDDHLLSVKALTPTELRITALTSGCSEMKVTYENGQTEVLVHVVKKSR